MLKYWLIGITLLYASRLYAKNLEAVRMESRYKAKLKQDQLDSITE